MTPSGRSLCLNMIVKNEAANIVRCLASVADHIGCWVIGDTGSTDGTQDIIRDFFTSRGIPGELHRFPFETFDQARNEALERARMSDLVFDYLLLVDADMEMVVTDPSFRHRLTADVYRVLQRSSISYWNPRLVRRQAKARYIGVTHEYLGLEHGTELNLTGLVFTDHASGSNRPGKFARDAALLRQALQTETDAGLRARYVFYLANSLRDDGDKAAALECYIERSRLGHWQEEVFVSLLHAAEMRDALGYASDVVIAGFEEASAACPSRAEALHGAACHCRDKALHEAGYGFATRGVQIPRPESGLFVADWVYEHGLLDELSIHAYWTGRYEECVAACDHLLVRPSLSDSDRARVARNRQFAVERLADAAAPRGDVDGHVGPLKIAVYTIALNEAAHVERWARSVEAADHRIVADTGSTDGTVELLKAAGVDVHQITISPWRFDDARNAALALVPRDVDICISLDMDNFMQPQWREAVEAAWKPGSTRLGHRLQVNFNPDGSPALEFDGARIHSRTHYRWRRPVHEELVCVGRSESRVYAPDVVMSECQDDSKETRRSYLALLELALEEDPTDSQLMFWFGRELMWKQQTQRARKVFEEFLALPTSTWLPERTEAMIYLSRCEPDRRRAWLERAALEMPSRREVWLELAEYHHDRGEWESLLRTCETGLEKARPTGSYLDRANAQGPRLHDLGALACWHLGEGHQSVEWGRRAADLAPGDDRLHANLAVYKRDAGL